MKTRKRLHEAFVLPHFNFCAETWHFCSKRSTEKLEKLNEQSLVWRDQSSTYQTLLRESGQTLTNQRPAKILGTVFKSVNQSRKDF